MLLGRRILCIQTFLFFFLLSPYKTIAFHSTTKGGCLSARIVIITYYDQILYDNKQPNAMLWSSSQMWNWLHPYSVGFILRKCAPRVDFIPKYSWLHQQRFSRANICYLYWNSWYEIYLRLQWMLVQRFSRANICYLYWNSWYEIYLRLQWMLVHCDPKRAAIAPLTKGQSWTDLCV